MKTIVILLTGLSGFAFAADSPTAETPPKGLAASDWSSIRATHEAGRHAIHRKGNSALVARNPGQQWRTGFDGWGFTITPDHGQFVRQRYHRSQQPDRTHAGCADPNCFHSGDAVAGGAVGDGFEQSNFT